jgi:hypothetical protein
MALACVTLTLSAQPAAKAKKTSNQILLEELRGNSARNVYDLIQSLRPQWLRISDHQTLRTKTVESVDARGSSATATGTDEPEIIVYLNNIRIGTPESLRDLSVETVTSLEFVSPTKATLRWGGGHLHGAIVVHTTAESGG